MSEQQLNESFAEDLFGVNQYAPELPKKKQFLPWHKPRKHFVRQKQWCGEILKLIEEIKPEDGILRYLGLPGDDLLDLRCFHHNICSPKKLILKFFGFNYSANSKSRSSIELNISLNEVKSLPHVDPNSNIIGDNFCRIANTSSLAFKESSKNGPYDVVNLDLCDGFGKIDEKDLKESYYDAINQLLHLQARRPKPWLFLLTTRTGEKHIDLEKFERLKSIYLKNLIDCPEFLNHSQLKFVVSDSASLEKAIQNSEGLSNIFLVSLCKWISKVTNKQAPPATVKIKSAIDYKVEQEATHNDIVSLAILITPTFNIQQDEFQLSTKDPPPTQDECKSALQALNKIADAVDADQKLSDNSELMTEITNNSKALLEEARYDITVYEQWIKNA